MRGFIQFAAWAIALVSLLADSSGRSSTATSTATAISTSRIKNSKPPYDDYDEPSIKPTTDGSPRFVVPYPNPAQPNFDPVYLSYDDLRKPLPIEAARPIGTTGKTLVVGNTLFVNEPNLGIHVFDITDPAATRPRFFIKLPGNVDLATKDGLIFADSFIDLVVIQLNDDKAVEVQRMRGILPWDAYQLFDRSLVHFAASDIDPKRGVIVDKTERVLRGKPSGSNP